MFFWLSRRLRARFRLARRNLSTGRPPKGNNRFWLHAERVGLFTSIAASLIAIGGVIGWLSEKDDREIDRAARVAQAVAGSYRTLNQARNRTDEIGQSDAFAILMRIRKPIAGIDLNDITITAREVPDHFAQQPGNLVVLRGLTRRDDHRFWRSGCTQSFSVDWLILREANLGRGEYCFQGDVIIYGSRFAPGSTIQSPISFLKPSEIRSSVVKTAFASSTLGASDPDPLTALPKHIALSNSQFDHMEMAFAGQFIWIAGSSFRRSFITLDVQDAYIGETSLRGARLIAPKLAYLAGDLTRTKCRLAASGSALETTCMSPNMVAEELDIDRIFNRYPSRPSLVITNSDIRGADLSAIPGRYLILENVCADATTKLPAGVRAAACGLKLSQFWDSLGHACPNLGRAYSGLDRNCFPTLYPANVYLGARTTALSRDEGADFPSYVAAHFGVDLRASFTDAAPREVSNIWEFEQRDRAQVRRFPGGGSSFRGRDVPVQAPEVLPPSVTVTLRVPTAEMAGDTGSGNR